MATTRRFGMITPLILSATLCLGGRVGADEKTANFLDQLQNDSTGLSQQIFSREAEIARLRHEVNEQIGKRAEEKERVEAAMAAQEEIVDALRKQIATHEKEVEMLTAALQQRSAAYMVLEERCGELSNMLSDESEKLGKARSVISTTQSELASAKEISALGGHQIDELQRALTSRHEQIESLHATLREQQADHGALRTEHDGLVKQHEELEDYYRTSRTELRVAKEEHDRIACRCEELSHLLEQEAARFCALLDQLAEAKQEVAHAWEEAQQNADARHSAETAYQLVEERCEELAHLVTNGDTQINELMFAYETAREELAKTNEKTLAYEVQLAHLAAAVSERDSELVELAQVASRYEESDAERTQLQASCDQLRKELVKKEGAVAELGSLAHKTKQDLETTRAKAAKQDGEISRLVATVEEQNQRITQLAAYEKRFEQVTHEKEQLASELKEQQTQLAELTEHCDLVEKRLAAVREEAAVKEERLARVNERIPELEKAIAERDLVYANQYEMQAALAAKQAELSDLQRLNQSFVDDLLSAQTTLETQTAQLGMLEQVKREKEELEEAFAQKTEQLAKLSWQNSRLAQNLAIASEVAHDNAELAAVLEDVKAQKSELERRLAEKEKRIAQLHSLSLSTRAGIESTKANAIEQQAQLAQLQRIKTERDSLAQERDALQRIVASTKTEVTELEQVSMSLTQELGSLRDVIEDQKNQLARQAELVAERDQLLATLNEKKSEIAKMEQFVLEVQGALSVSETTVAEQREMVASLNEQIPLLQKAVEEHEILLGQRAELQASLQSKESEIATLQQKLGEIDRLGQENSQLQELAQRYRSELSLQEEAATTIHGQLCEALEQARLQEQTIACLSGQIPQLEEAATGVEQLSHERERLMAELVVREANVQELEGVRTSLTQELNRLREETSQQMAYVERVKELADENEALARSLEGKRAELTHLEEIHRGVRSELAAAHQEALEQTTSIEQLTAALTPLQEAAAERDLLLQEREQLEDILAATHAEMAELDNFSLVLQEELVSAQNVATYQQQELKQLTASLTEVEQALATRDALLTSQSETIAQLQAKAEELAALQLSHETAEAELSLLKGRLAETLEELALLSPEYDKVVAQRDSAISETEALQARLSGVSTEFGDLDQVASLLKEEVRTAEQTVAQQQAEIARLGAHIEELDQAVAAHAEVEQERDLLQARLGEKLDVIAALENESASLNQQVCQLEQAMANHTEIVQERDLLEARLGEKLDMIAVLEDQATSLSAQLADSERVISGQQSELAKLSGLAVQLEEVIAQRNALTNDRDDLNASLQKTANELAQNMHLSSELDHVLAQRNELLEERNSLQAALQSKHAELVQVDQVSMELRQELIAAEKARDARAQELAQAQELLSTRQAEYNELAHELATTLAAYENQLALLSELDEQSDGLEFKVARLQDMADEEHAGRLKEYNLRMEREVALNYLQDQVDYQHELIATLEKEQDAAIDQAATAARIVEEEQASRLQLENRLEELIAAVQERDTQLCNADEIASRLYTELTQLQLGQEALTNENAALREYASEWDQAQAQVAALGDELDRLTSQLAGANEQISTLSNENHSLSQFSKLAEERQEALAAAQGEIGSLQHQIATLSSENQDLSQWTIVAQNRQEALAAAQGEIGNLQQQIADLDDEFREAIVLAQREIDKLCDQNNALENDKDHLATSLAHLKDLPAQYEDEHRLRVASEQRVAQLTATLEEQQNVIATLEEKHQLLSEVLASSGNGRYRQQKLGLGQKSEQRPTEQAKCDTVTRVHIVSHGDTLTSLAKLYHKDVQELYEVNRNAIPNENQLRIGTALIIP